MPPRGEASENGAERAYEALVETLHLLSGCLSGQEPSAKGGAIRRRDSA